MDVVDQPTPHEMYGFYLQNHSVHLADGSDTTGWQAHRACMGKANRELCINTTFTPELYEDDFTAVNAIKLLRVRRHTTPYYLQLLQADPGLLSEYYPNRSSATPSARNA